MTKNRVQGSWMIYGATGYTGTLIAKEAVRRGHRPLLAGRNAEKLRMLAEQLGLEWCAFSLEDKSTLREATESIDLMLNTAGPFTETCEPIMDGCLAGHTHYMDISNEIFVLQAAQARHHLAEKMGVSLIPSVGFGTTASNCLARHVWAKITDPVSLELVISPYVAQRSAGAIKSTLKTIACGAYVRKNGILTAIPFGSGAKHMLITNRAHNVLPVATGDLEAAYMSTGVANICVYMPHSLNPALACFVLPIIQKLLSWDVLRQLAEQQIGRRQASHAINPVDTKQHSWVWARATDPHGNIAEARLEAGEGYNFTASASIHAVEWVLCHHSVGAQAPAAVFGEDFVLRLEGVNRYDAPP